jgi:hypothetical protein
MRLFVIRITYNTPRHPGDRSRRANSLTQKREPSCLAGVAWAQRDGSCFATGPRADESFFTIVFFLTVTRNTRDRQSTRHRVRMKDKFDRYVQALASGTGPRPAVASPRSIDAATKRQLKHTRRDWPFESIRRDFKKWRPDTRRSSICVIVKGQIIKGQNERTHTKAR